MMFANLFPRPGASQERSTGNSIGVWLFRQGCGPLRKRQGGLEPDGGQKKEGPSVQNKGGVL